MGAFGRVVTAVALVACSLVMPSTSAEARPPWVIDQVPEGYRVQLRLDAPVIMRGSLPYLTVNGKPIGRAVASPDGRTLTAITTDRVVARATKVELVWSGSVQRNGRSLAGTRGADWSKVAQGKRMAVDPGATGPYQVGISEYDFGDEAVELPGLQGKSELRARVYTPKAAAGKRPLVVFLHGKHNTCYGDAPAMRFWPCDEGLKPIPSYRGYDDPARALASNGYQVVSISANGINAQDGDSYDTGAQARGELVLAHLDLWRKWSTTGGTPFGTTYVGKVDLQNVGLMGHSRGGEGVVRAGLINLERGAPYGIRAVQPLAPVNFVRSVLPGAALNVILPYCDGDADNLQGQHYFDDSRYAANGDRAARSTTLVIGANHNFFNTEWTPGTSTDNGTSFDDWEGAKDDQPCGAKSPQRLTASEQLAVGRAYIAGFFRIELGGEKALLPLLDGSNAKPASVGRAITRVTAQAATRYDLNRLDTALPADALTGGVKARACSGMACVASDLVKRYPHWDVSALAPLAPIPAVTRMAWTRRDGVVRFELAADQRDVRRFSTLGFRAAADGRTDFTVRVVDGKARVADVPVSSVSDGLVPLPGDPDEWLPRTMLRGVRIDLAALRGVDLGDVRAVEFRTDRVAAGTAYVSDLAFSKPGLGSTGPIDLPALSVSDAPEIVEGDSGTRSVDFTVSMSRPSAVPVSVDAETVWYRNGEGKVVEQQVQRVVFQPGQTRLTVEVPVHSNTRDGWDVSFGLVLSGARDAVVTDAAGAGKVLDDDPEPVLTIGDGEGAEGGTIRFPMKLSAPSDKVWWFEGEFVNGTAELGKDFRSSMAPPSDPPYPVDQGEILAGQTLGWLAVPAIADGLVEGDERFQVKVTSLSGDTPELPLTLTGVIHDR